MGSFIGLATKLEALIMDANREASDRAVRVANAIVEQLVMHTPVDTSAALSNWQVSLDVPASSRRFPFVPGRFGSSFLASAAATIADARSTLLAKKPGQVIYISNLSDYIRDLDEGKSTQQPAGFVRRAELVGRNTP